MPLGFLGLGAGGGCGVGLGLGWGFGTAFGSHYRTTKTTFKGTDFNCTSESDSKPSIDYSKITSSQKVVRAAE
ncbi:hypothetical protein MKW92_042269, partial [Papaver armeniacum]